MHALTLEGGCTPLESIVKMVRQQSARPCIHHLAPPTPDSGTCRIQGRHPVSVTGEHGWARLDTRDNALNAVRLVLAGAVVVGHSWNVGYDAKPPLVPDLAAYAVDAFFVLSGFLIAGSRERLPLGRFLWQRALRIFPGLWVVLVVTAFLFAPFGARVTGSGVTLTDSASYVVRNAALQMGQPGIGSMLAKVSVPNQWNGSLWTLSYEFACYLGLAALFSMFRAKFVLIAGVAAATTALTLVWPDVMDIYVVSQSVRFVGFFAAGAFIFLVRERVPLGGRTAAICVLLVVAAFMLGNRVFCAIAPLPLGYALLSVSVALPTRIGSRNDISFGMYVYAFPVQQTLVLLGAPALVPAPMFATTALALTTPFAWASWRFIERPALRLRKLRLTRHRTATAGPGPLKAGASRCTAPDAPCG